MEEAKNQELQQIEKPKEIEPVETLPPTDFSEPLESPEPSEPSEPIGEVDRSGISAEEIEQEISDLMGTAPTADEKQNVHSFLFNVARADDTTKLGNLKEEEVGTPKLPIRTYKDLALFCKDVGNMAYFHDYFMAKSEIVTSTSLSKDAKLINLAVMQRKEIADVTKPKTENTGWFKKKNKNEEPSF